MERITLTDDERALARRSPDKAVFVAVVRFGGPRGRRYRPIRTEARVTEARALADANAIKARRYAHHAAPTGTTLNLCDPLGNVLAAEEKR